MKKYLGLILVLSLTGCTARYETAALDAALFAKGLQAAENLTFDGHAGLYVTGLDGVIYLLSPDGSGGRIVSKAKLGRMCLGVEYHAGSVYAGVRRPGDRLMDSSIMRLSPDFAVRQVVSAPIPGLNGFALQEHYLYYTASEGLFRRHGRIYRVDLETGDFDSPQILADDLGWVNGLAFSADGRLLFYTEMFGGVWRLDLISGQRTRIHKPAFLQIFDDLAVAPDGSLWVCLNSGEALLHLSGEGQVQGVHDPADLGAPSACAFARGSGFDGQNLFVTEFGRKGGSLKKDGRGIWLVTLPE